MSVNELFTALKSNGLLEPLTNVINGSSSLVTTLSAGDICPLFCASCIFGHVLY